MVSLDFSVSGRREWLGKTLKTMHCDISTPAVRIVMTNLEAISVEQHAVASHRRQ